MLLDMHQAVRYKGLGAGQVVQHCQREFDGQPRRFAILYFPHRELKIHLPIGDDAVDHKLCPVLSESTIKKLLRSIKTAGEVLPRTWDQREEQGQHTLREGGPKDWATMLASYALAASLGVDVVASDQELVRSAQELLAAELALAGGRDFAEALADVEGAYEKAATPSQVKGNHSADHYAAVTSIIT